MMRKRVIGAAIYAVALLGGTPSVAQQECVGIESDIERLQCYDSAFAGSAVQLQQPNEHFSNFHDISGLLNFMDEQDMIIEPDQFLQGRSLERHLMAYNDCTLSFYTLNIANYNSYWKTVTYYSNITIIDLRNLTEITRQLRAGGSNSANFVTERGSGISKLTASGNVYIQALPTALVAMDGLYFDAYAEGRPLNRKTEEVRSVSVQVVATREDQADAVDELTRLMQACQAVF